MQSRVLGRVTDLPWRAGQGGADFWSAAEGSASGGGRTGWPRVLAVSAMCPQEWRPWGQEETRPSDQDHPTWSALAVEP